MISTVYSGIPVVILETREETLADQRQQRLIKLAALIRNRTPMSKMMEIMCADEGQVREMIEQCRKGNML